MSEKYNSIVVVLENDLPFEEADTLSRAFKAFRGVVSVRLNVSDINSRIAEDRARMHIMKKIYKLLGATGDAK